MTLFYKKDSKKNKNKYTYQLLIYSFYSIRRNLMENAKNYGRYAIIANGGKQYQVVEGKTVALELLTGNPGDTVTFDHVLFRKTAEGVFEIGQPHLSSVVTGTIVKHIKEKKLIVFRFKRRKKVRVKRGHRQQGTVVRITSI